MAELKLPGNIIWTNEGPAHFSCWVEKVKGVPVNTPYRYDDNLIYGTYRDAMTLEVLAPKALINRINKRQFFTYFVPQSDNIPDMSHL